MNINNKLIIIYYNNFKNSIICFCIIIDFFNL